MALAQLQAAEAAFGVDQAALATAQAQVKTIRATAFEMGAGDRRSSGRRARQPVDRA